MNKISCSMILKDGGPRLFHVLDQVRPFVDEIVVLDTGSTDGSDTVARNVGAKVIRHPWQGDFHFAEARNLAAIHCQHDLLLVLDADELIHGNPFLLRNSISLFAANDVYLVDVHTLDGGKPVGRSAQARLYDKTRAHYVGRVHNELKTFNDSIPTGMRLGSELITIEHMGYGVDPNDPAGTPGYVRKNARNLKLLELAVEEGDQRPQVQFHLARALMIAGREAEGLPILDVIATRNSDLFAELAAMIVAEKCVARALSGDRGAPEHLAKVDLLLDKAQKLARRFPKNQNVLKALRRLYMILDLWDGVDRTEMLILDAPPTFGGPAEIEIFDSPSTPWRRP